MSSFPAAKRCFLCECLSYDEINEETISLEFSWPGPQPRGGQFFMMKAEFGGVFLGRPISTAGWEAPGILRFIIARRGRGSEELMNLRPGNRAELSGPLGNCWADAGAVIPEGPAALISGGVGVAPLACYAPELGKRSYDFYAGFKNRPYGLENVKPRSLVIATEDGSEGLEGRIPDFFSPKGYSIVFSCGPVPMLKTVAAICEESGVPCYISMERHMACGTGACLGCTVKTRTGNRRCCADGPIFNAVEVVW
ncbi:dihydroorotate dehydrogenase [Leadbettera azotonutricia]|uniref:Dihydroorotate dehydrogenase, electron transfer subunit n=1 Tax=Leadbettera azotonutricia (strain ATCC BAA-888 / DSM 13862 / ZAS-9) TaxID=545695 RepID=F5Y9D7_LEAAZ|nr:dihydroorotate dehydrogenase [Leadbettera azotonutricia]AEF83297.1 dihydroorotate dehydrogenase, electron transfer subunit [Leadbettera azotonutricia ZAS-9]